MKLLFAIAGMFLTLSLGGCASLARKTVLPGSFLKAPANVVAPGESYELVSLSTQDGTQIVAQFGGALDKRGEPLAGDQKRPTVLFFYGNRMCIAQSQAIFSDLRRMGVNVLIPEYPGYGMSGGKASERGCYAAADAAFEYLRRRADVDPRQIVIAGMSLGGAVAVDLASRKDEAAGLLLVVPFASVRAVGSDSLAWYLRWAVPMIARHAAFDNVAKIPRVKCPVLLVQAKRDQVTTAKRTDELAAAAKVKFDRVAVDADHDGAWARGRGEVEAWLGRF